MHASPAAPSHIRKGGGGEEERRPRPPRRTQPYAADHIRLAVSFLRRARSVDDFLGVLEARLSIWD
jgi:hypothetical protein